MRIHPGVGRAVLVVFAAVAFGGGVLLGMERDARTASGPDDEVRVVVALADLTAGEPIPRTALTTVRLPARDLVPATGVPYPTLTPRAVFTSTWDLAGRVPYRRVLQGEIVQQDHVRPPPGHLEAP
ncbi:MAG: SAF domain-containing protein [Alphaproteobacteria bacterium]|nr:SAF domain-containing protein [Alphaproteobacteria bacterium]